MKKEKTFNFCEYCDKAWENISPPSKEEYKNGLIRIEEGNCQIGAMSILRAKAKRGSHCLSIGGVFCNLNCLIAYIKKNL